MPAAARDQGPRRAVVPRATPGSCSVGRGARPAAQRGDRVHRPRAGRSPPAGRGRPRAPGARLGHPPGLAQRLDRVGGEPERGEARDGVERSRRRRGGPAGRRSRGRPRARARAPVPAARARRRSPLTSRSAFGRGAQERAGAAADVEDACAARRAGPAPARRAAGIGARARPSRRRACPTGRSRIQLPLDRVDELEVQNQQLPAELRRQIEVLSTVRELVRALGGLLDRCPYSHPGRRRAQPCLAGPRSVR